jgi:hypothetical protein
MMRSHRKPYIGMAKNTRLPSRQPMTKNTKTISIRYSTQKTRKTTNANKTTTIMTTKTRASKTRRSTIHRNLEVVVRAKRTRRGHDERSKRRVIQRDIRHRVLETLMMMKPHQVLVVGLIGGKSCFWLREQRGLSVCLFVCH